MENCIEFAINQWKHEGIELNPPASIDFIQKAESILNFNFPDDFKQLYLAANGFIDFEATGFFLSLWSLDRIIEDYETTKKFVMFSDYSISVCQYGFNRNKAGIFKAFTHLQQGPIEFVAKSFKEMIKLFNDGDEILF